MIKQCFIDTETTSVNPKETGVWQIGGIIRYGNTKEEFMIECDIFEDDEVNEEILLEMHGKTKKDLSKLQDPIDAYQQLQDLFSKHVDKYDSTDKMFFMGYGVEFDYQALRHWFDGMGDKYFGSWFWHPPIDVMTLAMNQLQSVRHQMKNFKLITVIEQFNIQYEQRKLHTALYDAQMSMLIYDEITKPKEEPVKRRNIEITKDGKKRYILDKDKKMR